MGVFFWLMPLLAQTWFRMAEFNGFQSRDISAFSQCADPIPVSGRGGRASQSRGHRASNKRFIEMECMMLRLRAH